MDKIKKTKLYTKILDYLKKHPRYKSFILGLFEAILASGFLYLQEFVTTLEPNTISFVILTLVLEQGGRYLAKRNAKEVK